MNLHRHRRRHVSGKTQAQGSTRRSPSGVASEVLYLTEVSLKSLWGLRDTLAPSSHSATAQARLRAGQTSAPLSSFSSVVEGSGIRLAFSLLSGFQTSATLPVKTVVREGWARDAMQVTHCGLPVFVATADTVSLTQSVQEYLGESGIELASSTNGSISAVDLTCGVDSAYVLYSAISEWGDTLWNLYREQVAAWFRRRRQWALLAGRILGMSKRVQDARVGRFRGREREHRHAKEVEKWFEASGVHYFWGSQDAHVPVPSGWPMLLRARGIVCFLNDIDLIEGSMAEVPIDRHADSPPRATRSDFGSTCICAWFVRGTARVLRAERRARRCRWRWACGNELALALLEPR